jgi:hypothetical protein
VSDWVRVRVGVRAKVRVRVRVRVRVTPTLTKPYWISWRSSKFLEAPDSLFVNVLVCFHVAEGSILDEDRDISRLSLTQASESKIFPKRAFGKVLAC